MLAPLKDYHVYWVVASTGTFIDYPWNGAYESNFDSTWFSSGDFKVTAQSRYKVSGSPYWIVGEIPAGTGASTYGYLEVYSFAFDQTVLDELSTHLPTLLSLPALMIDLRPNTGGNDAMAAQLAALFATGTAPASGYTSVRYRASPLLSDFSSPITRSIGTQSLMPGCAYSAPVVVLAGATCMSACESFVAMAKSSALPGAKVYGATTRGSSGNPAAVTLSNDFDLAIQISRWEDSLPDGTVIESHGIPPDTVVEPPSAGTLSASQRTQWAKDTFDAGLAFLDGQVAADPGTSCAPSPPPPSLTPDVNEPCFPSRAQVYRADGSAVSVAQLIAGDGILAATSDGALSVDTVSGLSLADADADRRSFVTLTVELENRTLTLTPEHHVAVGSVCCSHVMLAKDVSVGDILWFHVSGGVASSC